MVFALVILLQDAAAIDAGAKGVRGMDFRNWKGVDDAEYLARVTRDLWGEAPSDVAAFVNDKTPGKRARKVDELLASPKFAAHWGRRLSLWLIGPPESFAMNVPELKEGTARKAADDFTTWMVSSVGKDLPWAEIVRAMIEARGESAAVPELGWSLSFAKGGKYPAEFAEGVGRLLGIRMYCASCHDHPYDRWTVNDYYGLAAFGARTRVRASESGARLVVSDEGEVRIPEFGNDKDAKVKLANGGTIAPIFLFGGQAGKLDDRLKVLSGLLTAKANTQFNRAFANQVWAWIFGKGVVDPPDDFNLRNKASSPQLLEALTKGAALKPLLRAICATEIYACVDTTEPAKAEWSSFRGQIVRLPDPPPKPFGALKLVIPESWTALPRRSLYVAPFRVPGPGGPATFGLGGGDDEGLGTQIVGGKPVTTVLEGAVKVVVKDVAGTYTCDPTSAGPRENWRILAATVTYEKGFVRYRLEGPAATVAQWRDAFLDLLKKAAP